MKKKLLILTIMLALFVCIFTVSVSAQVDASEEAISNAFQNFRYSTKIENDAVCGIVFSYDIDNDALASYKAANGSDLVFGVLTFKAENLNTVNGAYQSPSYEMGKSEAGEDKLHFTINNKHSNADLTNTGISVVDLILRGEKLVWEQSMADVPLYMIGYAYDGVNAYFMGTKGGSDAISANINDIATVTYNDLYGFKSGDFLYRYNSDGTVTLAKYYGTVDATKSTNIVIPRTISGYTVTTIGANAFNGLGEQLTGDLLVSLLVPNTITKIEKDAFANCDNLVLRLYVNTSLKVANNSQTNTWLARVTVEEGNSEAIDVISKKRPAIGWNAYI